MSIETHVPAEHRERIRSLADKAWSTRHPDYSTAEIKSLSADIAKLLVAEDAVLVAHYYVDDDLQELAESTGGFVGDSLEMARFGYQHEAQTVIVAGVRFMGETAKILSPEKRILMVETEAECSLDLACPVEPFSQFCDQHPERTVVVYANTSAAVKARADWVVTSSIALDVVRHLDAQGESIIWAPDRYLGGYIKEQTQVDMLLWQASCIVHEEFKADALEGLMKQHPDAKVLVHPESPPEVIALADVVGSTSQIINAARDLPDSKFIVATETGIFHKMRELAPGKTLFEAPTAGDGASCESCAMCPWMKMNDLQRLKNVLTLGNNEIDIAEDVRVAAKRSLQRMVDFGQKS